jgi:hypothetical protein
MQTTGVSGAAISENLSFAISRLEEMLNKQDSEAILQTIKNYKQSKNSGLSCVKNP